MDGSVTQLPADHFGHGTRSRYVKGCRCAPCRDSNRLYYHQRQALARKRLAELQENEAAAERVLGARTIEPSPQLWTAPDGSKQFRVYARACPGLDQPCHTRSHLRRDSSGNLCSNCRARLAFNGLVSAEAARTHLVELSDAGVGRRAVSAACDVASSVLLRIRQGHQLQIRKETERRILAVDAGAAADAAVIKATATWKAVRELQRRGWSKARISGAIGNNGRALQIGKRRVLASTAMAIAQLLEREKRLGDALHSCPRCGQGHGDDRLAAQWCLQNRHVPVDELEART